MFCCSDVTFVPQICQVEDAGTGSNNFSPVKQIGTRESKSDSGDRGGLGGQQCKSMHDPTLVIEKEWL